MEALLAVVGKPLWKLAVNEVENISGLEGKMEYLTKKVELLDERSNDVLNQVLVQELIGGRKRKREIGSWLKNVDEIKTECKKLNEGVKNDELVAKRNLGKEIVKKIKEVIELDEQSTSFGEQLVLDAVEPEKVLFVPSTLASQGQAFQRNLENVWKHVMDDNISSIGICGMGGVGKTTLAERIHNDLSSAPKFGGRVYSVTASQECSTFKLQNEIATAMKIDISNIGDERKKAGKLHMELKKKHNFVLTIDDVWKDFEVEEIGIPCGKDACKSIITSRSEQLCHKMGCEKVIKVEVLSEEEAWELFQQKLKLQPTTPLQLSPEVTKTAQDIAKRCGGLPLGIIVMARSMRGLTDHHDWSNVFVQLKNSLEHSKIGDEVFPILSHSFNRLEVPLLQTCFLYCSLYPEDYRIPRDELVRKFIVEGILEKRNIRKEELDQGYATLNKLEDVSLLVGDTNWWGDKCVKMHDLVRDMALRITRENNSHGRFMVKSGLQLEEIPSEDEWNQDLNKVSLMHNEISTIPIGMSPCCPNLTSLNLSNNDSLVSIPESFFGNLPSLQTLDLSWTGIETLPGSISLLVNLKGLFLGYCRELVSLPSLENLKELRELDLRRTENFDDEIGGLESLTNLKCLELIGSDMKMIASGTLKRLSRLQCLTLPSTGYVDVETIESLKHLEEFGGSFAKMDELRQFLKFHNSQSKLLTYDIQVGGLYLIDATGLKKSITIQCNEIITGEVVIGDDDMLLLRDTQKLTLIEDMFFGGDGAKCILRMREDREQQCRPPLESLEELNLESLYNLRKIIEVGEADLIHPPPATFSCLTKLTISYCPKMKKVFPRCFLDNLKNLEVLDVRNCWGMEEIVGEENEENSTNNNVPTLPKLRYLRLQQLPELKSIWKSNVNCNSIEYIKIKECKKLKKVSLFVPHVINGHLSPPPALKHIYIEEWEREWWNSLEWDHPNHRDLFQPFLDFRWL